VDGRSASTILLKHLREISLQENSREETMWAFVQKPEQPDATGAEEAAAEMLTHPGSVLEGPRRVENGLFVYEVVDHNGVEVRRTASFNGGTNRTGCAAASSPRCSVVYCSVGGPVNMCHDAARRPPSDRVKGSWRATVMEAISMRWKSFQTIDLGLLPQRPAESKRKPYESLFGCQSCV
jgi:hypothetical protein